MYVCTISTHFIVVVVCMYVQESPVCIFYLMVWHIHMVLTAILCDGDIWTHFLELASRSRDSQTRGYRRHSVGRDPCCAYVPLRADHLLLYFHVHSDHAKVSERCNRRGSTPAILDACWRGPTKSIAEENPPALRSRSWSNCAVHVSGRPTINICRLPFRNSSGRRATRRQTSSSGDMGLCATSSYCCRGCLELVHATRRSWFLQAHPSVLHFYG